MSKGIVFEGVLEVLNEVAIQWPELSKFEKIQIAIGLYKCQQEGDQLYDIIGSIDLLTEIITSYESKL